MNATEKALRQIHEDLAAEDQEIVGPLELRSDSLVGCDGRLKLQVIEYPSDNPQMAHLHVSNGIDGGALDLDACLVGIGASADAALLDAARKWRELVAALVFSLLHARPLLGAQHFTGEEPWGVPGCRGFAGPVAVRMMGPQVAEALAPADLFDFSEAMSPPGVVHLVKVTLNEHEGRWRRQLEVDGHAAVYSDTDWEGPVGPQRGIATRFAIFSGLVEESRERQRLDDAVARFAEGFLREGATLDTAAAEMQQAGVPRAVVDQVVALAPLAFARVLLKDLGARFSPDYIRVDASGGTHQRRLMREPAFARALMLAPSLYESDLGEGCKRAALTSAELDAINRALHGGSQPRNLTLLPSVVPDSDASPEAVSRAVEEIQQRARSAMETETASTSRTPAARPRPEDGSRPWWKFW